MEERISYELWTHQIIRPSTRSILKKIPLHELLWRYSNFWRKRRRNFYNQNCVQWRSHFPSVLSNTALECVGTTIRIQSIKVRVYGTVLSSMPFFLKNKICSFHYFSRKQWDFCSVPRKGRGILCISFGRKGP